MPFDSATRLLIQNLLTKNVFPAEMSEVIAAVAEAILGKSHPEVLKKMRLPSTECTKRVRYEVGALEEQLLHALKILKEEKRSLAKNVPAITATGGETIGEPTAQRAALDEEEGKRRRDLAEAGADASQAKKRKKRRTPTPKAGDRVEVIHYFDGKNYWCPGYVGGVINCYTDGTDGISYYVFYDAQDGGSASDAWERAEEELFEAWETEGGWRFEPADNGADEPEEPVDDASDSEEPMGESEDQDGALDVRPLEQDDDDDDDIFDDP